MSQSPIDRTLDIELESQGPPEPPPTTAMPQQVTIDVDEDTMRQGEQLLRSLAGVPLAGGVEVGQDAAARLDRPNFGSAMAAPGDDAVDAYAALEQQRSAAQAALERHDKARYSPDPEGLLPADVEARLKGEVEQIKDRQAEVSADAISSSDGWGQQWPWVQRWFAATDDPSKGLVDYLAGESPEGIPNVYGVGGVLSGIASAVGDLPFRFGDFVYDATGGMGNASTLLDSPTTRPFGAPESISGSIAYYGATYVAPFLLGGAAGVGAAGAGASLISRIAAGSVAGFGVNRVSDLMMDPVHEGSAASALNALISEAASSQPDPDAFLDEDRMGITLREVSGLLDQLDSGRRSMSEGRMTGRLTTATEGAVLDIVLGAPLVAAGIGLSASVRGAARSAAAAGVARAEARLAGNIGEIATLVPGVDRLRLIQSVDDAAAAVEPTLRAQGIAGNEIRDEIVRHADRYAAYALSRLRRGVDEAEARTLVAPLTDPEIASSSNLLRLASGKQDQLVAGTRLAALLSARRDMTARLLEEVRERRLSANRLPEHRVEYTRSLPSNAATQYERAIAAAGRGGEDAADAVALPQGLPEQSRVTLEERQRFHDGITLAKAEHKFGAAVTNKGLDYYRDPSNRMWMSEDGSAGVSVTLDGDLVSVYKRPGSSADINPMLAAASRRAITLDAFDIGGFLPSLYAKHGFRPAARVRFSMDYMPDGWNIETMGTPDIVLMVKDVEGRTGLPMPASKEEWLSNRESVPLYDGWDEAASSRAEKMRDARIIDRFEASIRQRTDIRSASNPAADAIEVERLLEEHGLGLSGVEPYKEEYLYQLLVDPANGLSVDSATARMQARYAVRFGQFAGNIDADQIRVLDRRMADQIIGMPNQTARTLFQKSEFRALGMASDMLRDVMDVPSGMRAGVDIDDIRGDEADIVLRPRLEDEHLRTLKRSMFQDLPSLDAEPEMSGMRPITQEEIQKIHADVIDEMLSAGLLPESLSSSATPAEAFQTWLRRHAPIPSQASEWRSILGSRTESGYRVIDEWAKIGLDPTDGILVEDVAAALSRSDIDQQEHDWLVDHISRKPPERNMVLTLGSAEFWNQSLTKRGADRARFWYEVGSERMFGDREPLLNLSRMTPTQRMTLSRHLSITSARTAIDENTLRGLHNFSVTVLQGRPAAAAESLGRHSEINKAVAGYGVEDNDNYKVDSFNFGNSSTAPRSHVAFDDSIQMGRADQSRFPGATGYHDLPVNDAIMAQSTFRLNPASMTNYTVYQFATRMQRRMRNLLNARRAELEASNPLVVDGVRVPREVWEARQTQAAVWTHYVGSGVDSKPPTSPIRNAFIELDLSKEGMQPTERPRATSFGESMEQMVEILSRHPDTRHYYDPSNPNAKLYPSGRPYLDGEVLSDDATWRIFQPSAVRRMKTHVMQVGSSFTRLADDAGTLPLHARMTRLYDALTSTSAKGLLDGQFNALLDMWRSAVNSISKVMNSTLRARDHAKIGGGSKNTSVQGELIAAVLGKKAPTPTAANDDEDALIRAWIDPETIVENLTRSPNVDNRGWRMGGSALIGPDGTLDMTVWTPLSILEQAEERRMAAAILADVSNDSVSVIRYSDNKPIYHRNDSTGSIQSSTFEEVVSGDATARDLLSKNAAERAEAESRTVVSVEILRPKGNAATMLVRDLEGVQAGSEILERGGATIRIKGSSKRDIVDQLTDAARIERYGITRISVDSIDGFRMTAEQGRSMVDEWRGQRLVEETGDWFVARVKKDLKPVAEILGQDTRAAILASVDDPDSLWSRLKVMSGELAGWRQMTRRIIAGMSESSRRSSPQKTSSKGWLRVVLKNAGLSTASVDGGDAWVVQWSDRLAEFMRAGDPIAEIGRSADAGLKKAFAEIAGSVRTDSAVHREAYWRRRFEESARKATREHASTMQRFEAWNSGKGQNSAEGVQRTLGKSDPAAAEQFLRFQQQSGSIRGVTWSPEGAGVAFIRGFNNADASTGIEELTHAIRVVSTGRGGRSPSYTTSQFQSLAAVVGVRPGGEWTRNADEDLASLMKDLILNGRMPTAFGLMPDDAAWTLSVMAAEVRDVWRDASRAGAAGLVGSAAMRQDVIRRLDTMPLPIRVGPGRYVPSVDWTAFAAHARSLRDQGKRWQDVIDPTDVLAHARIFEVEGRPVLRDPVTGMFIRATDRARTLSDPASREAMRRGTRFPKGTREEMFEAMAFFEDFVRHMSDGDPILRRQGIAEMQDEAINQFAKLLNQNDDQIYSMLDDLMKVDVRADQISERITTVNLFMKYQLHNVVRQAKQADRSKDALDYALLDREFRIFQQAQRYAATWATQVGRGLRSLREDIDVPTLDEIDKLKAAGRYMGGLSETEARGRDLVELVRGLDVENFSTALARRIEHANASPAQRIAAAGYEVFVNALLSAPRTFVGITVAGPAMMTMIQGVERALGATITGNTKELAHVGRNLRGMIHNTWTSMKYAAHAFSDEAPRFMDTRGLLDTTGSRFAISGDAFGMQEGPAKDLIDLTGRVVRFPTRVIMSVDEFFRQLHGRQAIYMDAYDRGAEETARKWRETFGGEPDPESLHRDADRFATNEVDRMIKDGRLRTREVLQEEALNQPAVMAEVDPMRRARMVLGYMQREFDTVHRDAVRNAEDYATRAPFQSELGPAGRLGARLIGAVPGARLIIPFYRTPLNILTRFGGWMPTTIVAEGVERAWNRAFNGTASLHRQPAIRGIHQRTLEDLLSGDPRRVAEARGRQAFGLGLFSLGLFLSMNGRMTGSGPIDPERRRAWSMTNQPYSIKIGGDWISYNKMDPVGMHLGLLADAMELLIDSEYRGGINAEKTDLITAMIHGFGQNLRNKSYLQGIATLMEALENSHQFGRTFARNLLTSAVPYSSLQRSTVQTAGDGAIREIRSLVDAYRARTWFGDDEMTPVARTPLGDPLLYQPTNSAAARWVNFVNPMMWMQESTDPVYRTINELGMLLDMPEEVHGDIDWSKVPLKGYKFSAYDWVLERIGTISTRRGGRDMTLRDTLLDYFQPGGSRHDQWNSLVAAGVDSTGKSLAEDLVRTVISAYRDAAWADLIRTHPEARSMVDRVDQSRRDQAARYRTAKTSSTSDIAAEIMQQAGNN